MAPEPLPPSNMDMSSFLYSNDDILRLEGGNTAVSEVVSSRDMENGKYAWDGTPTVAWCWSEEVWSTRLYHCIKEADAFSGVQVVPSYTWHSGSYEEKIGNLFPNVTALHLSPFHGIPDLILRHKKLSKCVTHQYVVSKLALQKLQPALCQWGG